jgi:hypothetical protein
VITLPCGQLQLHSFSFQVCLDEQVFTAAQTTEQLSSSHLYIGNIFTFKEHSKKLVFENNLIFPDFSHNQKKEKNVKNPKNLTYFLPAGIVLGIGFLHSQLHVASL